MSAVVIPFTPRQPRGSKAMPHTDPLAEKLAAIVAILASAQPRRTDPMAEILASLRRIERQLRK